jgi:hypothetical protein
MLPTYMVSPTMLFYCTYTNVADILLPSGGGGQALEVRCSVEILVYLSGISRPHGLLLAANKYGLSHHAVLLYLH